ncbi:microtubule-associated protein 4 isoform X5 [Gadus morhua]|uniref:microtubule-associated protein 4 isoform X5 n=1 Tax=Gadus morhua TaxID=8049 RepID=UPI0011B5C799|nr:microtubule-associated protein 4-like isoform X5 [Gadus morhua]
MGDAVSVIKKQEGTMDLSLRDALGGVGGGRGGLAPGAGAGDGVMKMDFMSSLEKETYDDKVGETMSKSDYRPLLDGKDGAKGSGPGMMSSMMSLGGRQDPAGQPAFSSDYLSGPKNLVGGGSDPWSQTKTKDSSVTDSMLGFSQPGMGTGLGMGMGAGMPPSFQSGMSSPSPAGFAQAAPGFGLDPKTAGSTGGSSPLKTSPGSGVHSMDQFSAAPALSPSGSLEDSSSASSASEPLGPHRTGPEGEVARQQQRRRKKKRKSRDEVYNMLDRQNGQSGSNGMISPASTDITATERGGREEDDGEEEEEEEEESWEWDIKGRGGGGGGAAAGGRVRGRKNKSRMRLPEEWGPPQEPPSPCQPVVGAPHWGPDAQPGPAGSKPLGSPTCVTNPARAGVAARESSARSYEPMCVDDFPLTARDSQAHAKGTEAASDPAATAISSVASAPKADAADDSGSLGLLSGENLSPVSQTFSFLDSVLQTPPASTPSSQTTTPLTHTPSMVAKTTLPDTTTATCLQTSTACHPTACHPASSPSKNTPEVSLTTLAPPSTPSPLAAAAAAVEPPPSAPIGSGLNPDAKPFVPFGSSPPGVVSSAASLSCAATPSQSLTTAPLASTVAPPPAVSIATPAATTNPPSPPPASVTSVTPTTPPAPCLPAHSEHRDASSPPPPTIPLLEGKPDNKDKQEKVDDKKEKEKEVQKQELQDKGLKSEKILKEEEAVKAEKSLLDRNEKMGEKIGEKKDKPEKTNKDEKEEEKKKGEEKKVEKEEKGGKAVAKSPTAAKGLPSPNGKNKPDAGSAKPNATKSRPSTLSTNGEASSAKRPSPTTASANKKSPGTKATTPTAAKKAAKTPDNSTAEKRPAVPKATPTPRASVNKPASPGNKVDKPEGKAADTKKAATPKTTAPRPRPRPAPGPSPSPSQGAAAASNGELSHRRRTLTKPPVPKQTPVDKKAAAAPRPPRTPRPLNTPTPDLKNIRSKIGSTDNIKYQPGGGKVTQNSKTSDSSTPAAKPRILNRKVDLSKVTSKCGSKDNIKHKPGGGDVKIESHKMSIKAKSKIGSLDNVGLDPPSSGATNGHKEKAENKASTSPSTAPTTGPGSVAKAGAAPGSVAKENGVKEPMPSTPFGGDGLNQPLSMNKQMTETN